VRREVSGVLYVWCYADGKAGFFALAQGEHF
jgi:hypothetical protein